MDSVLPDRRAGFGRARNINSELNGDTQTAEAAETGRVSVKVQVQFY